ncbi:unnamed protein product [Prunus armeniaca]
MELHCDNKSAIDIAHNIVQHDRTKHVVDRYFIKGKIENKIIRLPFVKSEDQLANVLTKAVCGQVFYDSLTKLVIGDVPYGYGPDFGFRPHGRPVDAVGDYHRRKNQKKLAKPFTISLATIN